VKPWQGFGLSLLVALGLHAAILLIPRIAGRGDAAAPTIEVSLASLPAGPGSEETQPAAAPKGGARIVAPPAAPAPPAAATQESSPAQEPPAAAPDSAPPDRVFDTPAATSEVEAAAGAGGTGSTAAPGSGGSGTGVADMQPVGAPAGTGNVGAGNGGGPAGMGGAGDSVVSKPRPRGEILPEYPRGARRAGWQGVVTIRAVVDETGKVVSAEILVSSGHKSLDQAALEAVKRALFDPARRGGKPFSSPINQPVRFTLN
jgi:protein TonB